MKSMILHAPCAVAAARWRTRASRGRLIREDVGRSAADAGRHATAQELVASAEPHSGLMFCLRMTSVQRTVSACTVAASCSALPPAASMPKATREVGQVGHGELGEEAAQRRESGKSTCLYKHSQVS